MKFKVSLILSVLLNAAVAANAQNTSAAKDSTIKSSTIEITQSYKPGIKQSQKPDFSIALPPSDTSHPAFKYNVPQQSLYYSYNAPPLKPLALGKDTANHFYPNYAKLGGGNLSTLYFDAGFSKFTWRDYELSAHLHHLSQEGNIKYQQTMISGLEANGTLHRKGNAWHASVSGNRNQYYYYGYNHDLYNYSGDSLKQVFTGFHASLDMQNEANGSGKFNYHPAVNVSYYKDNFKASETTFGFNAPVSYTVDSFLQMQVALNGTFTALSTSVATTSNNILQLVPGVSYSKGLWSGHIFLMPTFGKSDFYFLPDIAVSYFHTKTCYTFIGGLQGSLRQNTYEQLSSENPYMMNLYTNLQTHTEEVYAGMKGFMGNHISFSGRLSWWSFGNMPYFLNDPVYREYFYAGYYTNLTALSLQGAVRYSVANNLSAGMSMAFFSFSERLWHQPSVRIGGDVMYRPIDELVCTAYLNLMGGLSAKDSAQNTVSLPAIVDIGFGAEYLIVPRIAVFLQVNNLLNNNYQRWMNYQAYGINIYGGIRLKF